MIKTKKILVALSFLSLVSSAAIAAESRGNELPPGPQTFTQGEFESLFGKGKASVSLIALSSEEMNETEGAFNPYGALLGGIGGSLGYAVSNQISGSSWSWYGFGTSIGGGAFAGSGAGAVGVIWGFNSSLGAGVMNGLAGYYGW